MRIVFDFGFLCQRKAGRKLRRIMRRWIQQSAQSDKPTPSFRRYAAERRSRLVRLGRLLYPTSHDSAQFSPGFSLAKEAEIEYNPHAFWRGLRGFFSLPPRSGFVQPWNANNPPLRSGLSTFLFLLGRLLFIPRRPILELNVLRIWMCSNYPRLVV